MKHLLQFTTLCLFLLTTIIGYAQADYQLFRLGEQYTYRIPNPGDLSWNYIGLQMINSCQESYSSLRLKSQEPFGCYEIAPSFFGYEICSEPDETSMRLTEDEYISIKHNQGVGAIWLAGKIGDYFIYGEVTNIAEEEFLGVTDTVKYIWLGYSLDSQAVSATVFHTNPIRISKNYGMVDGIWFRDIPLLIETEFDFPLTEVLELWGISLPEAGIQNTSLDDIFSNEIGDEFHVYNYNTIWDAGNYYFQHKKGIYSVVDLQWDEPELEYSYILKVDALLYKESSTGVFYDSLLIEDSNDAWHFDYSALEYLNQQPGELADLNFSSDFFVVDLDPFYLCDKVSKRLSWPLINNTASCLSLLLDTQKGRRYVDGLAGPYYAESGFSGINSRSLVYFSGTEGSCGNPYDFSDIIINTEEAPLSGSFNIYPNPSQDELFLRTNLSSNYTVKIFNNQGQELWQQQIQHASTSIEIDWLLNGMYYLQLRTIEGKTINKRFIKL